MLKIRLMRIGTKKRPFYRIVAVDERNKRNGAYIDLIGTYNPLTQPKEIKIDQEKLDSWLKKGAQKSDGLLRILKEAPQKPPRKPKKGGNTEEVAATPATEEKQSIEETSANEEAPKEQTPEEKPAEEVAETSAETETVQENKEALAEANTEEPAEKTEEEAK